MGCDRAASTAVTIPKAFQSTHPRGVRLSAALDLGLKIGGFNPRTRVGCDDVGLETSLIVTTFQSTHPRGVRQVSAATLQPHGGFQSTHPRGVRPLGDIFLADFNEFQSTHLRGVRPKTHTEKVLEEISFNPRTRVGCDEETDGLRSMSLKFQSTHPRGVRLDELPFLRVHTEFQSTHPRGVRLHHTYFDNQKS